MEVILDGWLIKLHSDRRLFRKKRWNKYWFVLRHSVLNAGEIILEYYKDSSCHRLRGQIDLGQCEQLDSGLLFGKKDTIGNGFDIRAGNKIYYLVAETEVEMNKWVGSISTVCGLKLKDGDDDAITTASENGAEPLPLSPLALYSKHDVDAATSIPPSPYILISECFTGKPIPGWPNVDNLDISYLKETDINPPFPLSNYDYPRTAYLNKQEVSLQSNSVDDLYKVPPPPRICETDFNNKAYSYLESASSDDNEELLTCEGVNLGNNIYLYKSGPAIYHENHQREIVRKEALQLAQQLEHMGLVDTVEDETDGLLKGPSSECISEMQIQSKTNMSSADLCVPPPRPPKPNLHKKASNFAPLTKLNNISDLSLPLSTACTKTYDSHLATKIMDSNSAPQQDFKTVPTLLDDLYDIPKPRSEDNLTMLLRGSSSRESFHAYGNAPPAFIKREMPPYIHCEEVPLQCLHKQPLERNSEDADKDKCCKMPPLVDRNLKPKRPVVEKNEEKPSQATEKPSDMETYTTEVYCSQDKRNIDLDSTVERPLMYSASEIQYLDLNLDDTASENTSRLEESQAKRTTIYKTVDFLRTAAFNKTRQNVEEVYRSSS